MADHARQRRIQGRTTARAFAAVAAAAALAACSDGATPCTPHVAVSPAPDATGMIATAANSVTELSATADLCGAPPAGYRIRWFTDADGNGELSSAELAEPVAVGPTHTLIHCPTDRGDHPLRVEAVPPAGADPATQPILARDLVLRVEGTAADPERPACYTGAIQTVRTTTDVTPAYGQTPLEGVVDCLAPYLERNLCDFQANVAAGLARFALLGTSVPRRFEQRARLSVTDVVAIVDEEVLPLIQHYAVVAEKAPDDFVFRVDSKFQVQLFDDLPYLTGNESVYFVLQGEHDMGDIRGVRSIAEFGRAGLDLLLAYRGAARFLLDMPSLDRVDFPFLRTETVTRLVEDPEFLTIESDRNPDGRARLATARTALVNAIELTRGALDFVAAETDDQGDDLLRYWDCGSDGLCDCSRPANRFLACPNEPADYEGPDGDGTEGNGRYDPGEPVGIDRFGIPGFFALQIPSNIREFNRQIGLIRDNLIGPDALDLAELTQLPVDTGLELLAIPKPEIRLSQWFDTPSHPRDLVPLYDGEAKDFLFAIEGEPWADVGYDGEADEDERIVHWPNPRELTLGTAHDPLTNPDPHFDNLDPICTPVCNFTDGLDNDADGLADFADRGRIDELGFVVLLPQDLGVEANLMFDFVDLNGNLIHDPGEPSEPFTDAGVPDHRGQTVGAGDGAYSFADTEHPFPTGPNIGPRGDLDQTDPANGTSDDARVRIQALGFFGDPTAEMQENVSYQGLYDPFYVYLADPTLSGVLTFPQRIQSIDGRDLTANAKLLRFANKVLELGTLVHAAERTGDGIAIPPLNLGNHRCADPDACAKAVETLDGP